MLLTLWPNWWDQWINEHKVTSDGLNKVIIVNPGVTELNVKEDIYSSWKEWFILNENAKWLPALRVVGGDPISAGRFLGTTYFLINGWKIRTWEGDHRLIVNGNIYTDDGSEVFVPTLNSYNTEISINNSNLVDTVSIEGSSGGIDKTAVAKAVWDVLIQDIGDPATVGRLVKNMERKIDDVLTIELTR